MMCADEYTLEWKQVQKELESIKRCLNNQNYGNAMDRLANLKCNVDTMVIQEKEEQISDIEYKFKTIHDLLIVPLEKIPAFCKDLELWLSTMKIVEGAGMKAKNTDEFIWIDDNRHDVKVKITVEQIQSKESPDEQG